MQPLDMPVYSHLLGVYCLLPVFEVNQQIVNDHTCFTKRGHVRDGQSHRAHTAGSSPNAHYNLFLQTNLVRPTVMRPLRGGSVMYLLVQPVTQHSTTAAKLANLRLTQGLFLEEQIL